MNAPYDNSGNTIKVTFHPRTGTLISPQAVSGTITQALYQAYEQFGDSPSAANAQYVHEEVSRGHDVAQFHARVCMTAAPNNTRVMTNLEVVRVLSVLGFDFSQKIDVTNLMEYDFDVYVDVWQKPELHIASGSVANIANLSSDASDTPAKPSSQT